MPAIGGVRTGTRARLSSNEKVERDVENARQIRLQGCVCESIRRITSCWDIEGVGWGSGWRFTDEEIPSVVLQGLGDERGIFLSPRSDAATRTIEGVDLYVFMFTRYL